LVSDVNRDDDTSEMGVSGDAADAPAPGDPVGRVNLTDEPEWESAEVFGEGSDAVQSAAVIPPSNELREKVLLGLVTVVLMVLAMIVILQGVFEQKLPV
jgi:hypothetical protein